MKILYVGTFKNCPNADYISDAFEKLGNDIVRKEESELSATDVLVLAKDCDLILVEEARLKGDHWSTKDGVNHIEGYWNEVQLKTDKPIVAWLTNIFFGIMKREIELTTNPIFKAKIVFSTDGGHDKEFKAAGVNHHLLRQGIFEPEAYLGKPIFPTKAEVVFVGAVYDEIWPYRKKLIEFLQRTYGERFEHLGQRGDIRHDALNNLCATAKIVVGDSVYSPNYWSNRVYEIIGRGGFLIMPNIPGLEKEFTPYKHYVPYEFGNFDQLKEIVDYYLSHDEEREKIRLAGFEHCKKHHTYQKRVKEMLKVLKEEKIIK